MDELNQNQDQSQPVGFIPYHIHNGIDAPKIPMTSISNYPLYSAVNRRTLTSAQILALHTTPINLVDAPGTNSLIIVNGITAQLSYRGTAYTGANNLEFRYTDGSGTKVTADMAAAFINSGATAYNHVAGIITAFAPLINKPIVAVVPTANPGAGTGILTIYTQYRIIPFQV